MGGGSYTYLTIPGAVSSCIIVYLFTMDPTDQIANGSIQEKYLDQTVTAMLTTKFSLGLFESECH